RAHEDEEAARRPRARRRGALRRRRRGHLHRTRDLLRHGPSRAGDPIKARRALATSLAMPGAVVVGGGIGGLAAALALRRIGHEVLVLERADELREVGAGLS